MIKMKCKIDGNRIIAIDVGGITKIKNGDVFNIKNDDLINPEIQYLINKKIISVVEEIPDQSQFNYSGYVRPRVILFECHVTGGRRLTLDSIKGTVGGGERIEIKASDVNNPDIVFAIRNNFISQVKIADKEEATEKVIEEITKEVIEEKEDMIDSFKNIQDDDTEETSTEVEEVLISEIKETEKKDESPKFRINEDVEERLKDLAERVYEENSKKSEEVIIDNCIDNNSFSTERGTPSPKYDMHIDPASTVHNTDIDTIKEVVDTIEELSKEDSKETTEVVEEVVKEDTDAIAEEDITEEAKPSAKKPKKKPVARKKRTVKKTNENDQNK